jgi:hypothetical protein
MITEYYILPFSIGASVVSGIALGQIYDFLNTKTSKGRIFVISLLVLALPLFLIALINHVMNTRVQLTVDKNNALMIDKVVAIAPQNSLVLVNLNDDNEYIEEIRLHLTELYHRSDLTIDNFRFQSAIAGEADMLSYIILTPSIENKMRLSVRIGVPQEKSPQWNNALRGFLGGEETPAWSAEGHFRLFHIDFLQLLCPLIQSRTYCAINSPLIDRRLFSYGWEIYQVSSDVDDLDLPAVFKLDAEWEFQMPDGNIHHIAFGQPGDYPLVGDWNGDGISDIGVFRPDTLTWYLDEDFDGQSDIEFQLTGMQATDMPLAGDWDGDGVDTAGYFHSQDSSWHLRNSNSSGAEDLSVLEAGSLGDVPLVGDWVGDGRDTIGVYRPETGEVDLEDEFVSGLSGADFLANSNAIPVSADWAGRGFDSQATGQGPSHLARPVIFHWQGNGGV